MTEEQVKRIAQLLGFQTKVICKQVMRSTPFTEMEGMINPKMAWTPFNVNSDFAICRMVEKLHRDDYEVMHDKHGVSALFRDVQHIQSDKPFSQDGLAEVFLQVYGEE